MHAAETNSAPNVEVWSRKAQYLAMSVGSVNRTRPKSWVYVLPATHLIAILVSYSGAVIPALGSLGILFTYVLIADLPVSIPAYLLAWHYGALGMIWIVVAGTAWWYLLSRAAEKLVTRFSR